MNSKQFGNLGEKIAENYLRKKGYQILDRNYSFRIAGNPQKGEIDIVAKKDGIISFIEVKTLQPIRYIKFGREQFSAISPEEKVNFNKQKKLVKTAESWLMKNKISLDTQWQIDIIAIEISQDNKAKIRHLKNAVF